MTDMDFQTLRGDEERLRQSAVERANRWTEREAARLGVSPENILEAIKRGWLPTDIQEVTNRYALEDHPPADPIKFRVVREPRNRRAD